MSEPDKECVVSRPSTAFAEPRQTEGLPACGRVADTARDFVVRPCRSSLADWSASRHGRARKQGRGASR
jgi:hypothetical protein